MTSNAELQPCSCGLVAQVFGSYQKETDDGPLQVVKLGCSKLKDHIYIIFGEGETLEEALIEATEKWNALHAPKQLEWLPMSEAPSCGPDILLYGVEYEDTPYGEICTDVYFKQCLPLPDFDEGSFEPKGWLPLPKQPRSKEGTE